jgi:hypothetical protein
MEDPKANPIIAVVAENLKARFGLTVFLKDRAPIFRVFHEG